MIRLSLAALSLLVALAACNDDTLREGEAHARVEAAPACLPATPTACLDFGIVEAGQDIAGALQFGAGTTIAVALTGMRVEGADAAFFTLAAIDVPVVVAGASTLELAVTFSPRYTPGDAAHPWAAPRELYRASVVLLTDDPKRPELRADLIGVSGVASLRVEPAAIDFGRVAVGGTRGVQPFVLANDGDIAVVLARPPYVDEAGVGAGFEAATSFNVTRLEAGQRIALALGFAPAAQGAVTGGLVLESNDPRGQIVVPLAGQGVENTPPVVCLGLTRVFDRFGRERARSGVGTFALEPLDRALVTARPASDGAANSTCPEDSSDPEGDPVTFRWEPLVAPAGSHATLSPFSVFQALQPWERELLVDQEGSFTTSVVVAENNGVGLSTRGSAVWRVAGRGIAVTLDWGSADDSTLATDLDLHLVRPAWPGENIPAPRLCAGSQGPDCYWGNCKLTSTGRSPLDWGAQGEDDDSAEPSSEQLANNPLLARDSTGEAPLREQLSVPGPVTGDYELYVHFFEDARVGRPGRVPFSLQVTLGEQPVRTIQGELQGQGSLYRVGTIRWPAEAPAARLDSTLAGLSTLTQCR